MGRRLARSQIQIIDDMLSSGERHPSLHSLLLIVDRPFHMSKGTLDHYGSAPSVRVGRRRLLTPIMLEALYEHLQAIFDMQA